jgi:hypothetical protein
MLKTLQNFYKATTSRAWAVGTGNRYVSILPTPTSGYLVINPSNTTKREIVEYSGIGTDGNGNYVTIITRGVGGTTNQTHSIGEPVRINFTAEYYSEVQDEVDDLQDQIDTLVLQNAPNASDTVKGIGKTSVAPADANNPIFVGDNDPRITNTPEDFVTTSAGAADSGKGVKLNASGVLDSSFGAFEFGDGSDGDVTIAAGTTTLTRDMFYNNLVVTGTLATDGFRIFVKGTISGAGTIQGVTGNNGSNGVNGANHAARTGGAGGTSSGTGPLKTVAGGAGGNSPLNGSGSAGTVGSSGGAGQTGKSGGNGSAGADPLGAGGAGGVYGKGDAYKNSLIASGFYITNAGAIAALTTPSSGGGGGGGSSDSGGSTDGGGGSGGGGGASGGTILLVVKNWTGTFTITSVGGNGGNGGNGDAVVQGGNGGGGGGGNGGTAIIIYGSKTWTGSYTLTGGTGGTGGTNWTGSATAGTAGAAGVQLEIPAGYLL